MINMKKILFLIIAGISTQLYAQQTFISSGKIEFEKQVHLLNQFGEDTKGDNEGSNMWTETMKKNLPEVRKTYFDLLFTEGKSLYKPGRDVIGAQKVPDWILGVANENIVYRDINTQQAISQKTVFDNTFLVQDSIHKIDWKITNDTRIIAGFECKRATTVIMDSVFVVAFYTDQIITSSGPESFNGLPGMILGVAIPRLHATWFATKLELKEVKETELIIPKKGKKTTTPALKEQLKKSLQEWGPQGARNVWQTMI